MKYYHIIINKDNAMIPKTEFIYNFERVMQSTVTQGLIKDVFSSYPVEVHASEFDQGELFCVTRIVRLARQALAIFPNAVLPGVHGSRQLDKEVLANSRSKGGMFAQEGGIERGYQVFFDPFDPNVTVDIFSSEPNTLGLQVMGASRVAKAEEPNKRSFRHPFRGTDLAPVDLPSFERLFSMIIYGEKGKDVRLGSHTTDVQILDANGVPLRETFPIKFATFLATGLLEQAWDMGRGCTNIEWYRARKACGYDVND